MSAGGVNIVLAFGARLWQRVAPDMSPRDLASFQPVIGKDGRGAPATQHDAWLWISGAAPDVTWHSARAAVLAVTDAVSLVTEQDGFSYRGGRDITGFIDGTANPEVRRAADVAVVPPGRPGAGGSHVLTMRWVHDLIAFNRLSIEDQQRVIGRTKPDSQELPAAEKPDTAHISRVQTSVGGAGARDLPAQRALRNRPRARAQFRRLQRAALAVRPDARAHVRPRPRRSARPAHRLFAPGQRRLLLRAVAERVERAGREGLTAPCHPQATSPNGSTTTATRAVSRRAPAEARLVRLAAPSPGGVIRMILIVAATAVFLYLVWRVRGVIRLVGISLFFALALMPIVDAIDSRVRAPAGTHHPDPSTSSCSERLP